MKLFLVSTMVSLLYLFSGCAVQQQVPSDYDTSVNFSALKTYSWLESKALDSDDPRIANSLTNDRIVAAVDRQLAAQGFIKTTNPEATVDFKVVYHSSISPKTREYFERRWGYDPFPVWRPYPYHRSFSHTGSRVVEYDEGTLIVDILDAEGKKLLWRGERSNTVRKNYGPAQATARINKAVEYIMSGFPPSRS